MEKNVWSESKSVEFDRRIAEIHALREHGRENEMNIRHQEFRAMTDVFLGSDYDQEKLRNVEILQIELHDVETWLFSKFKHGEMDAKGYVRLLNDFSAKIFHQCAEILGENGFEQLFGAPLSEQLWHLDERTFIEAHSRSKAH